MTVHPRIVTLAGLTCVVVGLTVALLGDDRSPGASTAMGWSLLVAGIAAGACVIGYILGARHRKP